MRRDNVRATDEIVAALNERRIFLAYETVAAAADRQPAFYECLMRIRRTDGSLIAANEIVPVAERLGLVRLLDFRVLELVIDEMAAAPTLQTSFNVSPASTTDPDWWAGLGSLLAQACRRRRTSHRRNHRKRGDPGHRRDTRLRRPRQRSRLPDRHRRFRRRLHLVPQFAQTRRGHRQDRRRLRAAHHALGRRSRFRAHAHRPRQASQASRPSPNGCRTKPRQKPWRRGAAIICRARLSAWRQPSGPGWQTSLRRSKRPQRVYSTPGSFSVSRSTLRFISSS